MADLTEDERVRMLNAVIQCGGLARRSVLIDRLGRGLFERAVAGGALVRLNSRLYGLPDLDAASRLAHRVGGLLCLTSAALFHRWEVKEVPELPHVLVARGRKIPDSLATRAIWHRGTWQRDEVAAGIATSRELTLAQCVRNLPEDEALAIADSALRHGEQEAVRRLIASVRGPGRPRMLRVLRAADQRAENPFESVLRSICLSVPGLRVEPQRRITSVEPAVRPDLVDADLRMVIEADSFAWHGGRAQLRRDARRYDLLVADRWVVLRFSWEDVMFDPAFVRSVLERVVAWRSTEVLGWTSGAA
ncbi:MAG: hypothetical protein ACXVDH_07975 [Nocardioides sp.]